MTRTALVTGASRGIGRAIAEALAAQGCAVAVHFGRDARAAQDAVDAIAARGGTAFPVGADLGAPDGPSRLFAQLDGELEARFGTTALDVLVNNAGIAPASSLDGTDEDTFDRLVAVNLRAPFFVLQQAARRLRTGGRVVSISSSVARHATPEMAAYAMTKGAINTLTLAAAAALGPRGITVNAVAPGLTATDLTAGLASDPAARAGYESRTALGRLGTPADVAAVVAFLASDEARWVTGQVIEASGGLRI